MGIARSGCRLLFCRLIPVLVLLLAVFVGWCLQHELALGVFFKSVFTLQLLTDKRRTPPVPVDMKPMPRPTNEILFKLPGGGLMPGCGIGMCCRPTVYDQEQAKLQTLWFLMQGGRLIDTAALYLNHAGIGEGIKAAVAAGIPREEIFVTTKIWPEQFGYGSAKEWLPRALKELQLDYVDLVLLHSPRRFFGIFGEERTENEFKNFACKTAPNCWWATWEALAEFRVQGKVREVGVSNFKAKHMETLTQILKKKGTWDKAPIAVNQINFNAWSPPWEKDIVTYCQENNIQVTGYYTYGGAQSKDQALSKELLGKIAESHGKSSAQVLLRHSLQKGVAVIPGTASPNHMADNLNVFDFELSEQEMETIDKFGEADDAVMKPPEWLGD